MTFEYIVSQVMSRLNLTSPEAETRVGQAVNETYRDVTSSVSLETSVRGTATGLTVNESRYVDFTTADSEGEEDDRTLVKIMSVYLPESELPAPWNVLQSVTFDELRNSTPLSWPPQRYAIANTGAHNVRIFLDCEATDDDDELYADVQMNTVTLTSDDEPMFPENFHDCLIYGAMALELDKMEKEERAKRAWDKYNTRVAALNYFLSKDAYMRIHQNKYSGRGYTGGALVSS
jgi:hypothetical protein